MSYRFSPPTWNRILQMEGALVLNVCPVSTLVYRSGGTWFNVQMPGIGQPDVATQVDTDATTGILLFFTRPTVIPDSLATDPNGPGVATTPADPTWTPGSLVHL